MNSPEQPAGGAWDEVPPRPALTVLTTNKSAPNRSRSDRKPRIRSRSYHEGARGNNDPSFSDHLDGMPSYDHEWHAELRPSTANFHLPGHLQQEATNNDGTAHRHLSRRLSAPGYSTGFRAQSAFVACSRRRGYSLKEGTWPPIPSPTGSPTFFSFSPLETQDEEGLTRVADEAIKAGRYEEAVVLLTNAMEVEPDNTALLCRRSTVKFRLRRFEEAICDARFALSMLPKGCKQRLTPLCCEAQALEGLKKNKQALRCYRAALRIEPSNTMVNRKILTAEFRVNARKYGYAGRGRAF